MTGKEAEASVRVLTAEVRVLMVGSRQVTMSVYDQLDCIDVDRIEPFGRVRPKNGNYRWLHLIGVDPRSGVLVSCSTCLDREDIESDLSRSPVYRGRHRAWAKLHRAEETVADAERRPWMSKNQDEVSQARHEIPGLRAAFEELDAPYQKACAERAELVAQLAELPLIVLAGLR